MKDIVIDDQFCGRIERNEEHREYRSFLLYVESRENNEELHYNY